MDYSQLPSKEIERLSRNIHPGAWAIESGTTAVDPAWLLRCRLPVRPADAHRRDQSFHAAEHAARQEHRCRLAAFGRLRHGVAAQRPAAEGGQKSTPAGQGLRRRHDHRDLAQHRHAQRQLHQGVAGARRHPAGLLRLSRPVVAQGAVSAEHRRCLLPAHGDQHGHLPMSSPAKSGPTPKRCCKKPKTIEKKIELF